MKVMLLFQLLNVIIPNLNERKFNIHNQKQKLSNDPLYL